LAFDRSISCRAFLTIPTHIPPSPTQHTHSRPLSRALLKRHWPSTAHLAAAHPDGEHPYRLLQARTWHEDGWETTRALDQESFDFVFDKDGVVVEVWHPSFRDGPIAAGAFRIGWDNVEAAGGEYGFLNEPITLRSLLPAPLPLVEWAGCSVVVSFKGHRLWDMPLNETPQLAPSQPFFRATEGEERWQLEIKGKGTLLLRLLGVDTGVGPGHSPLGVALTVDCAVRASGLTPPLSHFEQEEVATAKPSRVERIAVTISSLHDVLHIPSHYALVKLLEVVTRVPLWNQSRASPEQQPPRELVDRFRGAVLVFEVLDYWSRRAVAFHHTYVVAPAEEGGGAGWGAGGGAGGKAWIPPIFQRGGAGLEWVEGQKRMDRSDLRDVDYRVVLIDPWAERAWTLTEMCDTELLDRCLDPFPCRLSLGPEYLRGRDGDGMRVRLQLCGSRASRDGEVGETVEMTPRRLTTGGELLRWLDMLVTGIWDFERVDDWSFSDDEYGAKQKTILDYFS
jgi:hypothetical protein